MLKKVKVKIKRKEGAKIPYYVPDVLEGGNTGADLFANEDVKIPCMRSVLVSTGLYVEVPVGVDMQIRSKSGMSSKHGVIVLNAPGTIDPSYRGEVKVILFNLGEKPYYIKKGDKIAQAVFAPILIAEFEEDELSETSRGEGGMGHTGIR